MAINKKLIHFNKKLDFNTRLANNEILDTSIVFIKDTQEIWTHGQLYKCSDPDLSNYLTAEDLNEINTALNTTNTELNALKTSVVDLTSDQTISGSKTFTSSKGLTLYNTNASDSELDIYSDASGNKIINNINKGSSTVASGMEINNFTGSTIKIRTYMPGDDVVRAYCTVSPDRSGTICANYLLPNNARRAAGLFISNGSEERGGASVGVNYGGLVTVYPPDNSDSPTKGVNSVTLFGDVVFRSYKDGMSGGDGNYAWMKYDSDDNFIDIRAITPSTNTTYETPILIDSVKINGERIITECIEITYSELKTRRDNSQLIPGSFYRITDYMTTTTQFGTLSAGHPFDVIVLALSKDALAEEAYAVHSERDTEGYFANSDLSAWKIWYSLDNDTTKFAWADAENGKGVIYRMIDEFNNDIPYDFKNIMYEDKKGFGYYQWGSNYTFMRNESLDKQIDGIQYYGYTSSATPPAWSNGNCLITDETPTITSALYNEDGSAISYGGNITSVSLEEKIYYTFAEADDLTGGSYGNEIKPYKKNGVLALNKIVFGYGCYGNTLGNDCGNNTFGNDCRNNTFGNSCDSNTFGHSCHGNFFGNGCYRNIFGVTCRSNTFGDNCYNNTFGGGCSSNTFEYGCQTNTFGDNCSRNSFGNDYTSNTFGNNCSNNAFGNNCRNNTFGNSCTFNIFGGTCTGNTFGNNCSNNAFGNNCSDNSFGNECSINSFGNNCDDNIFGSGASEDSPTIDYCRYNHFDDGCSYNVIWSTVSPSDASPLRNININRGVCGKYNAYNYINIETLNSEHEINVNQIDGIVSVGDILSIRHASLKSLRNNGQLIAGQQYRIIDYVTTTSQAGTKSAGHQFDLIVTADDNKTLNEKVRAIQHEGDTYFANSDLNAWEVWYCIDNDSERFAWGDFSTQTLENVSKGIKTFTFDSPISHITFMGKVYNLVVGEKTMINSGPPTYVTLLEGGQSLQVDNTHGFIIPSNPLTVHFKSTGVIYRMIDEFGNDCPYDFKNIQFKRKIDLSEGRPKISEDAEETWVYTFAATSYHIDNDEWSGLKDGSLESPYGHMSDEDTSTFHHNVMKPWIMYYNGDDIRTDCGKAYLNNNVMLGYWEEIGSTNEDDVPYYYAYCCTYNTLGDSCTYNSFGNSCINNSFGNDCYNNTLGDSCTYNSFGNSCSGNTIGNNCHNNNLGDRFNNNTFGDSCSNNTFGNDCHSNTFGDLWYGNTLGDSCHSNTFGNDCYGNTLGDSCTYNSFGNSCINNSFRMSMAENAPIINFCQYNHFDDACSYNVIWNSDAASSNALLKNINVNRGVSGTSRSYNYINITTLNQDYELQVAKNSKGEIKIYCEADLIA